jgi:integrase
MKHLPTAKELAKLTKPGRHAVGHGAYLQISEWGTRAWVFRYIRQGRARHVGMGSATYVTLAEARERAFEYRRLLAAGGDPLEQKRGATRERQLTSARMKTFRDVALDYISQHEHMWRGDGSRRQWLQSLERHAFPKIGSLPIADIGVPEVLLVLDPIWRKIPETAGRVKHRLALILDWAAARELRGHDNPVKRPKLLPARKKRVGHHPAMPYQDVPALLAELRQRPEITARAIEFAILCAARPGEVTGARWDEISGDIWEVPPERMKSGRAHRVPLSRRAVELLAALPREGDLIFPGRYSGTRPHTNVMVTWLRRMGHPVTTHGFRASFKTWATERTNYPRELIEAALAHVIGDAAEQAYSRGDMLAKRRQLMEAWSGYLDQPHGVREVLAIRAARS